MEARPHLPRVLKNVRSGFAMEVMRGHKFAHIINADGSSISYDRVALSNVERDWKEFSTDIAQVRRFCEVCLGSFRSKTERVTRTLREIMSMTIDVKKATTQELIDFYNSKQDEKKKVKKFADRKTAEERVSKILASLSPATTGIDADAPLPPEVSTASSSNNVKGKTMSKNAKTKKADKPTKAAKAKSTTKPKKAGTIAAGVKASWNNKKVAAARAVKHNVKVGGEVYRSVAEAFTKLKLKFADHVKFRKELKQSANGRATYEGKTFTLVEIEA